MGNGDEDTTSSPGDDKVLRERLHALSRAVTEGFSRIEKLLGTVDDRVRKLETSATADLAVQKSRLEAAFNRIDENKSAIEEVRIDLDKYPEAEDVKKMVDDYPRIKDTMAGVRWLAGTVSGLIILLIWAMITGSISVTMLKP